jgi:hypothetical protein
MDYLEALKVFLIGSEVSASCVHYTFLQRALTCFSIALLLGRSYEGRDLLMHIKILTCQKSNNTVKENKGRVLDSEHS